jgi:hypothetical protein
VFPITVNFYFTMLMPKKPSRQANFDPMLSSGLIEGMTGTQIRTVSIAKWSAAKKTALAVVTAVVGGPATRQLNRARAAGSNAAVHTLICSC